MKKIVILIPVFNDWESLKKLLSEINENLQNFKGIDFDNGFSFCCLNYCPQC